MWEHPAMADFSTVRYEVTEGVARITLARRDKRNAVNDVMFGELGEVVCRACGHVQVQQTEGA